MDHSHRSLYSVRNWIIYKHSSENETLDLLKFDITSDDSEFVFKSFQRLLDFYWLKYYKTFGTCFQSANVKCSRNEGIKFCDFLRRAVDYFLSNSFHGFVKTIEVMETLDKWDISTSVPPTTLYNCIRYIPSKLLNNDDVIAFIIYQIICAVEELHLRNIPHLNLLLNDIYIDENFVVKIGMPDFEDLYRKFKSNQETLERIRKENENCTESQNLDHVVWKWISGDMSNLDYILYLNKLTGRTESDPNNHPMIPWVTDFSEMNGGFRNLRLSKFRINKGDEHLNKIFQDQQEELERFENWCPLETHNGAYSGVSDIGKNMNKNRNSKRSLSLSNCADIRDDTLPSHPHHVSDILSELSYYAYMARVTPVETLKKSYRSSFNPHEFRWDMAKMYAWTPDECIPQFYTDPSIFRSIHPDMPDIELPLWCNTPEDFVRYHRDFLESDEVSSELHHWIDLVFGYKLFGEEAVCSKNVHRQFSSQYPDITNNGLMVLFRSPHPKRLCCDPVMKKYFGFKRPEIQIEPPSNPLSNDQMIYIPEDYNFCEFMNRYQEYSLFIQDSCASPAVELKDINPHIEPILRNCFDKDIASICCLMVELFVADKLPADYPYSAKDLKSRVKSCLLLFTENVLRIPLSFRESVKVILTNHINKVEYTPDICELKRSAKWFSFNKDIKNLQKFIYNVKFLNIDIVMATKQFLFPICDINQRILKLTLPHLIELIKIDSTKSHDQIFEILILILQRYCLIIGKSTSAKEILPHILKLYPSSKDFVTSSHAVLYQRNFLNLLFIRIGMTAFMNGITSLLVRMLVIGQDIFSSSKESNSQDVPTNVKWYLPAGGDDEYMSSLKMCKDYYNDKDDDDLSNPPIDEFTLNEIEKEEPNDKHPQLNGCIPSSVPNRFPSLSDPDMLGNLPLDDADPTENKQNRRPPSIGHLFVSPFKQSPVPKNKPNKEKSGKLEQRPNKSQDCSKMSLAKLSCSSLVWLADIVGPIQASSRILSELFSQYSYCYRNCGFHEVCAEQLNGSYKSIVTGTYDTVVQADIDTVMITESFKGLIGLYGMAIIDHQFRHFLNTLLDKSNFSDDIIKPDTETSLICSVALLRFLVTIIPDENLLIYLSESVLDEYLPLIIRCIGNKSQPFPNGRKIRNVLMHKAVDLIYIISSRIPRDQIHVTMCNIYQLLFGLFSKVFDQDQCGNVMYHKVPAEISVVTPVEENRSDELYVKMLQNNDLTILTPDPSPNVSSNDLCLDVTIMGKKACLSPSLKQREAAFDEIKAVITCDLAYAFYVTFAKLLGENKLSSLIYNNLLIQALMSEHDKDKDLEPIYSSPDKTRQQKLEESLMMLTKSVTAHRKRHLTAGWNQYWAYQLGFSDAETYDIKQICLGKFESHTHPIKGFDILSCENGFLSFSKDRIVKLYSCADIEYSNISCEVSSRYSFHHQKPVSDARFIEEIRMAISLDGTVNLWDPYIGKKIQTMSLGTTSPSWSMLSSVPPSHFQVVVANQEGRMQIVDLRTVSSVFSFHLNISNITASPSTEFTSSMGVPGGFIRQVSVAPDGHHIAVGNSDGYVSFIETRMCRLINTLRPHQSEISQIKFIRNWCVTSSAEPNGKLCLTSLSNFSQNHATQGSDLHGIHSLMILPNQILAGASQNRFGLFSYMNQYTSLNRLSSSLFRGSVTSASLLLHNKLLLLGNDLGHISIWY